jgi:hypothetical protein
MQGAAAQEAAPIIMRAKRLHVSEVLEVFGRHGCFGLDPAWLSRQPRAIRLSDIKKRGFLFLRHLPHCDWHSQSVGLRHLRGLIKRWKIITEASWRKSAGMPVITAAASAPQAHLRRASRLASSFIRLGVVEDVTFILFTHGGQDSLTLLDGNHRALALQLAGEAASLRRARFRVIVGTSTSACSLHGDVQRWVKRPLAGQAPGRYILDVWNQ